MALAYSRVKSVLVGSVRLLPDANSRSTCAPVVARILSAEQKGATRIISGFLTEDPLQHGSVSRYLPRWRWNAQSVGFHVSCATGWNPGRMVGGAIHSLRSGNWSKRSERDREDSAIFTAAYSQLRRE